MNIGFCICAILALLFLMISALFAIFKEKAAKYVSGFQSLSKAEQMAVSMLENGELDCISQVCIEYTITEV